MLVSPGMCFRCKEESDSLDKLYDFERHNRAQPQSGGLFGHVMTGVALALLAFILYHFAAMFADWILGGGRPWL